MTNNDEPTTFPTCGNCGMTTNPAAGGHETRDCPVFYNPKKKVTPEEYMGKEDKDRRRGRR